MNAKTMEGLSGANTSIHLLSTPISVAKEAERKGETDKLQRAMGYAAEMTEQAGKYSEKSSEGMKLDAKEEKEKEKLRQEELIEARKKEREELEKRIEAERQGETAKTDEGSFDFAEISEAGKQQAEMAVQDSLPQTDAGQDAVYDKSGEVAAVQEEAGGNVDVSV